MTLLRINIPCLRAIAIVFICLVGCTGGGRPAAVMPEAFDAQELLALIADSAAGWPVDEIAALARVPAGDIAVHTEDGEGRPDRKRLSFHWPSPEAISFTTISGETVALPRHHSFGIGNVRPTDRGTFEQHQLTGAGIRASIDELANDTSVDADIAIAQTAYLAEFATGMTVEKVARVGESAVWELPTQALHVYADGVAFTVTANFGDDPTVNQRKAIELTQLLFNRTIK